MKTCAFPDCGYPYSAKGYCKSHYQQYRLKGVLTAIPRYGPTCTFPACGRPHRGKGLCASHVQQQRRTGVLTPLRT